MWGSPGPSRVMSTTLARATAIPTTAAATIGVAGGSLDLNDEISLTLALFDVPATTEITITNEGDQCDGMVSTRIADSPVYAMGPVGTTFAAPVQLTLHYDEDDLQGMYEDAMVLYARGATGWTPLETVINLSANTAHALVADLADIVLTSPNAADGVYVEFGTGMYYSQESLSWNGRMDYVFCRFDVVRNEDRQVPLEAGAVSFSGEYMNYSNGGYHFYEIEDPEEFEFLFVNDAYTLFVEPSADIPQALFQGVTAAHEVYVTNLDVDTAVPLAGYTMEWAGAEAGGDVEIVVSDRAGEKFRTTVPNDGSYALTAADLADVNAGDGHVEMTWRAETPVAVVGFDLGSICFQECVSASDVIFTE